MFKMLYIDTLVIVIPFCSQLSILNKISLQKESHNVMKNIGVWTEDVKTQKEQKQNANHCQSQESNPGHLTPESYVLPQTSFVAYNLSFFQGSIHIVYKIQCIGTKTQRDSTEVWSCNPLKRTILKKTVFSC